MTEMLLAHGEETVATYGTEWLYFLAPFPLAAGVIAYLFVSGGKGSFLARVSASLERVTGLPAWSAGGIAMGILALVVAVLGFYWDVAWHIELGRDEFIFTPAHMGILVGLALIMAAGLTAVVLATHARAESRVRLGRVRIPLAAIPILLLGVGALLGFPLDELWHQNYGIDVTMWGPTHLVMISGASLTPIALLLLYTEGRGGRTLTKFGRWIGEVLAAALVLGLSTWTGEFDFGVPQFQALYHPVLVMTGSAMALVAARYLLGPGGALRAALGALVLRGVVALVVGAGLGLVIPRFPLYLGSALAVEAAFALIRRTSPVRAALAVGVAVATFGFISEWAWMSVWGRHPWSASLLPAGIILPALGAVAATILGSGMGRVFAGRPAGIGMPLAALCGALILFVVAAPLPRNDTFARAVIETERSGDRAFVEVTLDRPELARGADWFEVLAWQGGAVERTGLTETSPGVFRSERALPVAGEWKTIVRVANANTMVAAPVYLPADPEIGASEIPLEAHREVELRRDTDFLLREATEGAAWPALVAYGAILILAVAWIAALARVFVRLQPREDQHDPVDQMASAGIAA